MDIKEICDTLFQIASEKLFADGYFQITFFIVEDTNIIYVPELFPLVNARERSIMGSIVCEAAKKINADAVVMVSESWMVKDEKEINCAPSEHPNRFDILMLTYMEANGSGGIIKDRVLKEKDTSFVANRKKYFQFKHDDDTFRQGFFSPWK